jgi:hypothetical protein
MNILDEAQLLLKKFGYTVSLSRETNQFYFENETVFGFVWKAEDVTDLVSNWRSRQDGFLRRYSKKIEMLGRKSWNAYSVMLSQTSARGESMTKLWSIQEDVRATRKIAVSGIVTEEDLVRAIYPLLPIQHLLQLTGEDFKERARQRLREFLNAKLVDAFLGDAQPSELIKLLRR